MCGENSRIHQRGLPIICHRRDCVTADVEWFHTIAERHRPGHAAAAGFLAIDEQLHVRRFAGSGLDRGQLHPDDGLALGQDLARLDAGVVHLKEVIGEGGLAVLHIE
jgi:hypothetical protein